MIRLPYPTYLPQSPSRRTYRTPYLAVLTTTENSKIYTHLLH